MPANRRALVGSVAALYAAYFFSYFHRTVTGVLQQELEALATAREWGDPRAFAALASSAYFYTYAVMQLPAGVLADALGARRYAAASTATMALGSLLLATGEPPLMVLGRLVVGLGAAAIWVSLQRVIGVLGGLAVGGRLTGLGLMVGGLASLAAALPTKVLAQAVGLPHLFLCLGLVTLAIAAAVAVLVEDEGLGLGSVAKGVAEAGRHLKVVARSPHSLALVAVAFGTYSALLAFQSYWGARYLNCYLELSDRGVAELLTLTSLSFALFVPLVGYVSDVVVGRRKPVMVASCTLHAAAWAVTIAVAEFKLSWLLTPYALALGAIGATHAVIAPMAREAYDPSYSGTSLSFVNAAIFAAAAIYQLAGCAVEDSLAITAVFLLASAVATLLSPWLRETLGARGSARTPGGCRRS